MVAWIIGLCLVCLVLGVLYIRLCLDIRSLAGQLGEIERGSHIELAVNSRQRCLLALCRQLNQVLTVRDRSYIQYKKAQRQLKQNITSLAHDIRTPLTGAFGYMQLAGECREQEKQEHYLLAAEHRLGELKDMLENLFLYTKLANEEFVLSWESMHRLQVVPLLGECLLSFYADFEEQGIAPEIRIKSQGLKVFAEEETLRRIFLNLIQNALVHGAGGLTVTSRESEGEGCILAFENPVDRDQIMDTERLFEQFYKADTARGKGSSGLGLFIVREMMRKLGGDAWAEVEEGVFRILLVFDGCGHAM